MIQPATSVRTTASRLLLALGLCWLGAGAAAHPARPARTPQVRADVAEVFSELARQRPWECKDQSSLDAPRGWQASAVQCAWQERLRMRSWTGPGGEAPDACVSIQARWWAWAGNSGRAPATPRAVWDGAWTSQSLVDDSSALKRIVLIERLDGGQWRTVEWRWDPSPRAATRRWQERRWALLAERAAQFAQPARSADGPGDRDKLRAVLLANVGARVAEIGGDVLNYQTDGLCLQADLAAPGQQQLELSYSTEDSRLEQRAAMQLQLARRFPKATWLSTFNLLPMPPTIRSGAKFYAVWLEGAVLKGQLWIPVKGGGPLVRVRITTALPPSAAARPDAQPASGARRVLERELMGLAARWATRYE